MGPRDCVTMIRPCRLLLMIPLIMAGGPLPAAALVGPDTTSVGEVPSSCMTHALRPPPCPLWYWNEPAPEPSIMAGPSLPTGFNDRRGIGRRVAATAVVASSITAATLVDLKLRHVVMAEDPDRPASISDVGNLLGNGRMVVLATGATYGLSRLVGYEELSEPAGRALVVLAGAGAVNGALKVAIGRARPRLEVGSSEFRPFSFSNSWQSFPSGHAVTAFAVATVIASETDEVWVTGLTYGAAGLVAWSRSHEDRHWVSDTVAGAAVGTVIARYTLRYLDRRSGNGQPPTRARLLVGPGTLGVALPAP